MAKRTTTTNAPKAAAGGRKADAKADQKAGKPRVVEAVGLAHSMSMHASAAELVEKREKAMQDAIKKAMDEGIDLGSEEMQDRVRKVVQEIQE